MTKGKIITYLKVSILSDLLIQYIDDFEREQNIDTELISKLEKLSNIMYESKDIKNSNMVQMIQNKVDTIFRKNIDLLKN